MWLTIGGLLNLRDLGGTPTADGRAVRPGRLWRSENQTGLAASDLRALVDAGLTDVIDLRTDYEVDGSPSPLEGYDGVRYHHHSFFREAEDDDADILDRALPWVGYQPEALTGNATADSYLAFLADRPDSVLGALRAIRTPPVRPSPRVRFYLTFSTPECGERQVETPRGTPTHRIGWLHDSPTGRTLAARVRRRGPPGRRRAPRRYDLRRDERARGVHGGDQPGAGFP